MVDGFAATWDGCLRVAGAATTTAEMAIRAAVDGRDRARRSRAGAMAQSDDQRLMMAVAEGDEPAFRVLAARHLAWALRLAGRVAGNPADAEDIVQEAMLRVWVNAPKWKPAAEFRTWFYRVVVNLSLDRRRRPPLASLEDAGEPIDPNPDPQAALDRGQSARAVAAAIAELPDRQRLALVLTYYEELSNAEVARSLGTTVGGVEGLLVRARRALRLSLGPDRGAEN